MNSIHHCVDTYLDDPDTYIFHTDDERMDDVVCTGSETKLTECENYITFTSSNTAIGMSCEKSMCYVYIITYRVR